MPSEAVEAQEIIDARLRELEAMSWEELDRLGRAHNQIDEVVAPSGRCFARETIVFWDMEEWASGMELGVEVQAEDEAGSGRLYDGWSTGGGPADPVPDPPGGWQSPTPLAWLAATCLLITLILGIGAVGFFVAGAADVPTLAMGALLVLASGFLLRRVRTRRRPVMRSD